MGSTVRRSDSETATLRVPSDGQGSYGSTETSVTAVEDVEEAVRGQQAQEQTPLNMGQIVLLSMARISEPLTFGILFPFVQQMIVDTGEVAVEDVGYSVGMVEISFSITQSLSLLYWARAADRWGRKPVLIASLFGALASTTLFGFCKHVWQMYACRFLAGVFGGNAMVIRTLFTENCDSTNQATAFAYFAFAANMGTLLGPTIGGFFADPAKQWPNIFGHVQLFIDYPYSLPGLVCGTYIFASMLFCFFWLKETRPDECDSPLPVRSILTPEMISMLAIFGWTVTVVFSQGALFPLYLFTPVAIGGQGKTPPQIAVFQGSSSFFQALWLLIALPRLDRRIGTKRTFNLVSLSYPLVMLLPIIANAFARGGDSIGAHVVLGIYVSLGISANMTFTSVQLLLNSCAPPAAIATVNGIAVAICGIVKSIFPALLNATFALSVSQQIVKGYLAWIIMSVMAAGVFVCSWYAPENAKPKSIAAAKRAVREADGEEIMETGRF